MTDPIQTMREALEYQTYALDALDRVEAVVKAARAWEFHEFDLYREYPDGDPILVLHEALRALDPTEAPHE